MWIFSSDLQLIGGLIAEYTLLMTELAIIINVRLIALYDFFLDHLKSSDLRFDSESYDTNIKMYPL